MHVTPGMHSVFNQIADSMTPADATRYPKEPNLNPPIESAPTNHHLD